MGDQDRLVELAASWRSAGNISRAVSRAVNEAYALGMSAGLHRAAEIAYAQQDDFTGDLIVAEAQ